MKTTLCYTSQDGGFDWLEKEYRIDEINFEGIIQEYIQENKAKALALSEKWELDGNPDPLFLNFRMSKNDPKLFELINSYLDIFS